MNYLDSKAWKLRRAWSAIEEYFRGDQGKGFKHQLGPGRTQGLLRCFKGGGADGRRPA